MGLWRYLMNLGIVEDEDFNVLTGGKPQQTFSVRWALRQREGKPGACFICAMLSWMVQKDHCSKVLDNIPMTGWNYARAAFWISVVLAIMLGLPVYILWRIL